MQFSAHVSYQEIRCRTLATFATDATNSQLIWAKSQLSQVLQRVELAQGQSGVADVAIVAGAIALQDVTNPVVKQALIRECDGVQDRICAKKFAVTDSAKSQACQLTSCDELGRSTDRDWR